MRLPEHMTREEYQAELQRRDHAHDAREQAATESSQEGTSLTRDITLSPLRLAAAKAVEASQERDDTIRKYHADGVSIRTIAECVDLSSSRVHQILHGR